MKKPLSKNLLEILIVESLVGIEQMMECEEETKHILEIFEDNDFLSNLSKNIIVLNGWIQEIQRKKK
jgi:hypothetical protein